MVLRRLAPPRQRPILPPLALLLSLLAGAGPVAPPAGAQADPNLNATLWMQTSAEYRACVRQGFVLAAIQLERALADPGWTACLEQTGDVSGLPPAIVLDIDETLLDNSIYEARLVRDGGAYTTESFNAWCVEAAAAPLPGAVEFCRGAAARGVTVFYVTSRRAEVAAATRALLARAGFPLDERVQTVLCREGAEDKAERRAELARDYRILLLVGDNAGDFAGEFREGTAGERRLAADRRAEWWGTRWIIQPNPAYGDWERALYAGEQVGRLDRSLALREAALRFDPPDRAPSGVTCETLPSDRPRLRQPDLDAFYAELPFEGRWLVFGRPNSVLRFATTHAPGEAGTPLPGAGPGGEAVWIESDPADPGLEARLAAEFRRRHP